MRPAGDRGVGAAGVEAVTAERVCGVCGASLAGRRAHARYCRGACRAEASRLRRILAGQEADGWASLPARQAAARKRTEAAERRTIPGDNTKRPGAVGAARGMAPKE